MEAFNVFALELNDTITKVGPERGFAHEGDAHSYALTLAAGLWNNRRTYSVIHQGDLLAAYHGAGLRGGASVHEEEPETDLHWDWDELDRAA